MINDTARHAVFTALYKVIYEKGYSNIVFSDCAKRLNSTDKKFAATLFYGVLERKITLDAILKRIYDRAPDKITNIVLLMGAYQIKFMNSVPDFAAVNSSVELIKSLKKPKSSGFVNAVLHKVIKEDFSLNDNEKYSVIPDVYNIIKSSLNENTDEFFGNSFGGAPVFVRINTRKTTEEKLKMILDCEQISYENTELENVLSLKGDSIFKNEAFDDGLYFVQDLSCQLAIDALDISENDVVYDLCAAPGGKSFSAALKTNKPVFSFDIFPHKTTLIENGAKKLGLDNIIVSLKDGRDFNGREYVADKVICDVPCSGFGVIRRKPEIRFQPKNTDELITLQHDILFSAGKCVKTGGVILYSTCTVNRCENEEQVERFLKENDGFRVLTNGKKYGTIICNSGNTFFPKAGKGDGFFYCLLERIK